MSGVLSVGSVNRSGERGSPDAQQTTQPRYTGRVVAFAKSLHEGGWGVTAIRRMVGEEFGVPQPSANAVRLWVDPAWAERRRESQRREMRKRYAADAKFRFSCPNAGTVEYREAFVRRLADEGVSVRSIPRVLAVMFDEPLTYNQCRYIIEEKAA